MYKLIYVSFLIIFFIVHSNLICLQKIETKILNKIILYNSSFEWYFYFLPNLLNDILVKKSVVVSSKKDGNLFTIEFDSHGRLLNFFEGNTQIYELSYIMYNNKTYVNNKIDSNMILVLDNKHRKINRFYKFDNGVDTLEYKFEINDKNVELESSYIYNIYDTKFRIKEEGFHNIDWYSFIFDERYTITSFSYYNKLCKIDVNYKDFFKYSHEIAPKYNTVLIEYDSPTTSLIKTSEDLLYHKIIYNRFSLPDSIYFNVNSKELTDTIIFNYIN